MTAMLWFYVLQLLNAKLHYVAISGVENGFFGEIKLLLFF